MGLPLSRDNLPCIHGEERLPDVLEEVVIATLATTDMMRPTQVDLNPTKNEKIFEDVATEHLPFPKRFPN